MNDKINQIKMETVIEQLRCKGYAIDGERFPTGRGIRFTLPMLTQKKLPVVAKYYPLGGGETTFRNMQELWRSGFGERRIPPGIPEPLDYLDDIGVLIMERINARPFLELDPFNIKILDDTVQLIAAFHDCDAQPEKRRKVGRIIKSIRRKAVSIAEAAPHFKDQYVAAADALEAIKVEDLELVPSHGDFEPRNVLVASTRLVLIDWDRYRQADPIRDLAYMGCWYWASAVQRGEAPDWSALNRIIKGYKLMRPKADVVQHLNFHVAAGLLRMAYNRIMNLGTETFLVPHLIKEAMSRLK